MEIVIPTSCLDACAVIAYLRNEPGAQILKEIKVEERVSFADAFALALTERLSIPLVATDHHECVPLRRKATFDSFGCASGNVPLELH